MRGQSNGGVIINVSSIHGNISVEYMTAYAASKAGLDRLTAGLASEWANDNVRVNAVAPGVVPVERTAEAMAKKEVQDLWRPHLPVGRMGTVEEIAHSVVYLCENEWSTGTILTIDGGMTARANMPFRPKPSPSQ
jgi:glucose 1-dehydrogenase